MSKGALVVGSKPAALQVALDLADSGLQVHLVEAAPFLGEDATTAQHLLTSQMLRVVQHPLIQVLTQTHVLSFNNTADHLQVELRQDPRYVDLARCTACGECVAVCPVGVSGEGGERRAIFGNGYGAVPNIFAIEKLGSSPCKIACPASIHVQGYVALIAAGRFLEALNLIREAVPFPGVLGRVCHHPCEEQCRRGTVVDKPVAICALKRFVADYEIEQGLGETDPPSLSDAGLGRVAIIGAGPSGLTAAYFLAKEGISCEVFEALPVAGGMMAVGIPAHRLPAQILQREIDAIKALGVQIHLNHPVDAAEWARLTEAYDAVFVGIGAHQPLQLAIPGEELKGVISGLDFLRQVNLARKKSDRPRIGKEVVVVGGGNVAIDSAMVARRLGAQTVTVLYRRSRAEMPANPWEIEEAEEEEIQFHYLAAPVRAIGENGRVTALECIRMVLGEPDESGRRRPVPVEGSEFTIPCDTLLPAVGQRVACSFAELPARRNGTFEVDPLTLQSEQSGVFAGGDAVSGPASVVEAIAAGRRAAESIARALRGESLTHGRSSEPLTALEDDYFTPEKPVVRERAKMGHLPLKERLDFSEINLGLDERQAVAEAQRCLDCAICSECLACERVCEPGAILHDQTARTLRLDVGSVVWADDGEPEFDAALADRIHLLRRSDALTVSAVAARAMADLAGFRQRIASPACQDGQEPETRVGVLICRCGNQIGDRLDVPALVDAAQALPEVVVAQSLPFACHTEGAVEIEQVIAAHDLSHLVLAACSCCSLDQICFSCTYQRVRCKGHLLNGSFDSLVRPVEFVNIREQCAWVHQDAPALATAKARRLVAATVARVIANGIKPAVTVDVGNKVLIAGCGAAAAICAQELNAQGFAIIRWDRMPSSVAGAPGQFVAQLGEERITDVGAVVLAPADSTQLDGLLERVGPLNQLRTRLEGLFVCPAEEDGSLAGAAAAAKVGALLGSGWVSALGNVARVDAYLCRACGTCETVCEYHAITVTTEEDRAFARVSPTLCHGCGTCAAHCPSSAITAGDSTDRQVDAILTALLADSMEDR